MLSQGRKRFASHSHPALVCRTHVGEQVVPGERVCDQVDGTEQIPRFFARSKTVRRSCPSSEEDPRVQSDENGESKTNVCRGRPGDADDV